MMFWASPLFTEPANAPTNLELLSNKSITEKKVAIVSNFYIVTSSSSSNSNRNIIIFVN